MQLALLGQVKSEFRILWGLGHVLNNHEWEIPISAFTFKEEYLNFQDKFMNESDVEEYAVFSGLENFDPYPGG